MVLGRFRDVFSFVASRLSGRQSSTDAYKSSSPPLIDSSPPLVAGFSSPALKNNIRLSSSLQDLSAYRRLDLEEGNHGLGSAASDFRPPQRENAGSSFSKEKALPGGSSRWPIKKLVRTIVLFLCLLLVCFLIYTVSMYIYSYWSQGTPRYFVVLDCGSTGTRAYVYQANINYKKDGALPIAIRSYTGQKKKSKSQSGRAYDRMETEPGLDKLVRNVTGLKKAIKPLLHWAEKQIPKRAHESTSLFLYATAGVRKLPPADSKWILDNAWSILKSSRFLCQREWVKTITGTEEAYYGWIALNYQKQLLGVKPRELTYGALDLGGSSLQVTFESKERNESSLNIRIGNVDYHLNAYSLTGYGLNDAFGKSVVHLLRRIQEHEKLDLSKFKLNHPCLHSGYNEKYTCNQCGKLLGRGGNSGISLRLIGAPNWEECSALAKVAVNFSEWSNTSAGLDCDVQPCAITNDYPPPYGNFYAISGFFVVFRFFNLTSEAALDDVLEKGHKFCEKPWEVARASVAPQPFIEQYCFRAPYVVSLLREGLHITDKQIIIGSGSTTWTLGVSLLEGGKTSAVTTRLQLHGYKFFKMKIDPLILIVVLFTSLFFLLFALSCVGSAIPRFFRRPYLPIFRHNTVSTTSVLNIPSPFRLQRWSPMSSGDGRVKMPLSPTVKGSQERPFGLGHGFGSSSGIQLMESSLHRSSSSMVSHSYSSNSLGQMQFDSNSVGSFWTPRRSQMRLQSRRSQSREDLSLTSAETHMVKV
ncbi:probable apyrase 7 isoform X1 [Cucurbita maxima]|uniref:Probable apyrase 7 isoform X1 n=1 Tax=Cucurbita maxima TaxID=3661 RepID=A0A6J1IVE1_CUCMA|nr:probable apyrase 7 isoform X1 [Cucurbita maxima]